MNNKENDFHLYSSFLLSVRPPHTARELSQLSQILCLAVLYFFIFKCS